jgi:hypothetical protein
LSVLLLPYPFGGVRQKKDRQYNNIPKGKGRRRTDNTIRYQRGKAEEGQTIQ